MSNRLTKGQALLGGLDVGTGALKVGGETIRKIDYGTVSIDPASIAATTRGTATATIAGVASGDVVAMFPPSGLEAALLFVGSHVSGADSVTVSLYNTAGVGTDGAALTWEYLWIDFT